MITRCDKAMRRSKEKCYTPFRTKWRCKGECKSCMCCIIVDANGEDRHLGTGKILEGSHERTKE